MKKRQQIATNPLPCNVESSSGAIEEQQKLSSVAADDSLVAIDNSLIGYMSRTITWYCNMYSTGKPFVATDESCSAADDTSILINDLSVGRNFWFSPSLTWYCNMYPTGNPYVATYDLPVGYAVVKF
ncbi:hypothetical protein H5410_041817 [Solanum commersonii]|uniref:Uncharacterized protein n=1 Tax=Solanum commersonii TaxID=4109 RepID=A0A9J5XUN6_SOLCO|nr:hypothetical protein H5410_041817 [Solanum commersonii]